MNKIKTLISKYAEYLLLFLQYLPFALFTAYILYRDWTLLLYCMPSFVYGLTAGFQISSFKLESKLKSELEKDLLKIEKEIKDKRIITTDDIIDDKEIIKVSRFKEDNLVIISYRLAKGKDFDTDYQYALFELANVIRSKSNEDQDSTIYN